MQERRYLTRMRHLAEANKVERLATKLATLPALFPLGPLEEAELQVGAHPNPGVFVELGGVLSAEGRLVRRVALLGGTWAVTNAVKRFLGLCWALVTPERSVHLSLAALLTNPTWPPMLRLLATGCPWPEGGGS